MDSLAARFVALTAPHPPRDWELAEILEPLAGLPPDIQDVVLAQVPAIWNVSHSLCVAFLESAVRAASCLSADQFSPWVNAALATYESSGLQPAIADLHAVESNFLCRLRGEQGVCFSEAAPRLQAYAQGLAGYRLELAPDETAWTDTVRILLPREMKILPGRHGNAVAYKLAVTVQLLLAVGDTFRLTPDPALAPELFPGRVPAQGPVSLADFLDAQPDPTLIGGLYHTLETIRACNRIQADFPGLWRDSQAIARRLLGASFPAPMDTAGPIAILRRQLLQAMAGNAPDPLPGDLAGLPLAMPSSALDSLRAAHALGEVARHAEPAEHPGSPPFFQGAFRPREAALAMAQRRAEAKRQFVEALAALLPHGRQAAIREALGRSETAHARDEDGAGALLALPPPTREGAGRDRQPVALTIGGIEIELPESLRSLAREIGTDLGGLPLDYVASAAGIPGHAPSRETGGSVEAGGQPLKGLATYDEWDFRRKGFKKDWCTLQEKPVAPVRGTFVSSALARHRGLLLQLRRQFEMLRTQHRFLKRQAEGDDLDLDALTDSLSDARAGLPPSERVFIRLQRDARNVAAIFLVDMSASTEGWVSVALRESLLLMGEALHTVGDRFAMYGFSGMRRLRSDLFVVKTFTESFGDECKNRIAGILPQEYTRMGPPIRHATEIFRAMDASIRLLVVLSDGKPEDYDDYKGDYAIEDTRHALIEAKTCGIHPFCITIDRQARDAVRHMYGEVNYAFISDVRGLPRHLPAIYRRLTS